MELPGYDRWKLATPPEYEWAEGEEQKSIDNEIRDEIDALIQVAETAEHWMEIVGLCKRVGDEPPFHFSHSPYQQMVAAFRSDWDLGMPTGMGKTELEAVADLLEQEDAR